MSCSSKDIIKGSFFPFFQLIWKLWSNCSSLLISCLIISFIIQCKLKQLSTFASSSFIFRCQEIFFLLFLPSTFNEAKKALLSNYHFMQFCTFPGTKFTHRNTFVEFHCRSTEVKDCKQILPFPFFQFKMKHLIRHS